MRWRWRKENAVVRTLLYILMAGEDGHNSQASIFHFAFISLSALANDPDFLASHGLRLPCSTMADRRALPRKQQKAGRRGK